MPHDVIGSPASGVAKEAAVLHAGGQRTSALMRRLVERDPALPFTVAELVESLGHRAFGFLLILFAIPCTLPAPFPIPALCCMILAAVAGNLVAGRRMLWLPGAIRRRALPAGLMIGLFRRVLPWIERLERVCRPRWLFMSQGTAKRLSGLMILLMVVVLLLPIPVVGNFTPGLAILVAGVGLAERDGRVTALSFGIAALAVIVSAALAAAAYGAILWMAG
jgi:hypothetical protein